MQTLEIHAREKFGLSEDWKPFRFECFPNTGQTLYIEIEGAIVPLNKHGYPYWKKLDKATKRTLVIPVSEHETWKKEWEAKTGKCSECIGTGKTVKRVSVKDGTEYRDCRKCGGSGSA